MNKATMHWMYGEERDTPEMLGLSFPGEAKKEARESSMDDLQKAQQNARIMGVLYGLIRGQEINTKGVWYQDWSYETCLAAHCTHQEFKKEL